MTGGRSEGRQLPSDRTLSPASADTHDSIGPRTLPVYAQPIPDPEGVDMKALHDAQQERRRAGFFGRK